MIPYHSYLLYEAERPKTAGQMRMADERAGRTIAAISAVVRLTVTALQGRAAPDRAAHPGSTAQPDGAMDRAVAAGCARMSTTMEAR